ncbi:MAG TPA: hypothetical protein VII61_02705, partial [Ktedonobacteraceae bacterium]
MKDYRKSASGGPSSSGPGPTASARMGAAAPWGHDSTVHTFPGAMFTLGGLLLFLGLTSNGWQLFTTFTAFWSMFNPTGTPVNAQKQPIVFIICGLIAIGAQVGLALIVWKIDKAWKRKSFLSSSNMEAARSTAVEIVQQVGILDILCALSFIVDTIGDFTFIAIYTVGLGVATSAFITFLYAAF